MDEIVQIENTRVTLTDSALARILPQETASSGLAPESEPSNSCPVFLCFKVQSWEIAWV